MSGLTFRQIADMCGTSVAEIEKTYYHLNAEIRLTNAVADYIRREDGYARNKDSYTHGSCSSDEDSQTRTARRHQKTRNEQTSQLFVYNHRYQINKTTEINAENQLKVDGL